MNEIDLTISELPGKQLNVVNAHTVSGNDMKKKKIKKQDGVASSWPCDNDDMDVDVDMDMDMDMVARVFYKRAANETLRR